ncbi:hypothetical protein GCM10027048_45620 [Hymenobacter coalescens]
MKRITLAAWLLTGLVGFGTTSCLTEKPDVCPEEDSVKVSYAQTQCADQWGQAATPQQLEAVAGAYLQQQGIQATGLSAARTGQAVVCAACTCPTGLVLTAKIRPADLPAALSLGFQQL